MFKKALQIATAFGVLLASYAGYVHVFALVARGISQSSHAFVRIPIIASKTQKMAHQLAIQAHGPDHWSAAEDNVFRLYNAERGFWMYFQNYKRLKDGKQIEFRPFLAIWPEKDGPGRRWVTSDTALVDLDQPFDLAPSPGASNSLRVVHARIEGNVHLHDDKGTPNRADDLRIGPMTYMEYDEATLQVLSESDVLIEDDVKRIFGQGMVIKLRPKDDDGQEHPEGRPAGFSDAQTAYLRKNVEVEIYDVGAGGGLPGTATPSQTRPGDPTPLHVRSDGPMQVDFPKRRTLAEVGPQAPEGPTIVQFSRNVEVMRGKPDRLPDTLSSDHLRLTFVPPPKSAESTSAADLVPLNLDLQLAETTPAATEAGPPGAIGPPKDSTSNLVLEEAHATGHNVRLVSESQGMKAGCNELIYRKLFPIKPDETYLRGDHRVVIEKVDTVTDGPKKGEVARFMTIRAIDVTIFDDHRGNDYSTIYARGPGDLESRPGPGLNGPIQHTARWDNELIRQPVAPPGALTATPVSASAPLPPPHQQITLTGRPVFNDLFSKSMLEARQKKSKIIVWLKPKPTPAAPEKARAGAPLAVAKTEPASASSLEIEKLYATDDVHLTTPGRTQVARSDLQAVFIPVDEPARPAPASGGSARSGGTSNASQAAPANGPAAPANGPATAPAAPAAPAEPSQPEARSIADRVWARVLLRPAPPAASQPANAAANASPATAGGGLLGGTGSGSSSEIDQVRLRGNVAIHEDPAPGKLRGTEIVGEAVDLFNQGGKGSRFIVYANDPKPKAKLPVKTPELEELFQTLAMVDTDEMVIRGKIIGLDQATDHAWVDGNGSLTQMASAGLLSDKSDSTDKPAAKATAQPLGKDKVAAEPKKSTPMTIFFAGDPKTGKGMLFYGAVENPYDPGGGVVARADFFKDVHAETEDAMLDCSEVMHAYFDQSIKLIKPKTPPPAAPRTETIADEADPDAAKPAEPRPEIAKIECVKDVLVINVKRDPITKDLLQKQRIEGEYLLYDKRTGDFFVPGEGMVFLYERDGQGNSQLQLGPGTKPSGAGAGAPSAGPGSRRTNRPIAGPGPDEPRPIRRDNPVVGRNETRGPIDLGPSRATSKNEKPAAAATATPKPLPPLVLTQIYFTYRMDGRFGSGLETDKSETRRADFYGDVEALRAKVDSPSATLDPDHRPADATFLTSQILRVISEPPTALELEKNPSARSRSFLRAWENALASSGSRTILGDTITFDSLTNNFYAYGENGRDVQIIQQEAIGQVPMLVPGRAMRYNTKTGESVIVDPLTANFLDLKTGYRPLAPKPSKDEKPRIPNRKKFMNTRSNIERKDFTGH